MEPLAHNNWPTRPLRAADRWDPAGNVPTDPIRPARRDGTEVVDPPARHAPGPMAPLPRIEGYELLDVLGRGGMGVVYKARQHRPNRLVALKLILAGDHARSEDVARFFREAEAVGALHHPNIVQVYEVGEHDGRPFLSLEYVEGGTLRQRIQDRPQPPAFAAEVCETVARAVHAVHSIHIVHRDLKPANILLQAPDPGSGSGARAGEGPVPVAKIADFGLAKRLDQTTHLTETGTVAGTPAYMAPEQVRGDRDQVGPAADVWALGVILYEMLTGRPPFHAECPVRTMSDVLHETPALPRRRVPDVPRDLETICLKCLEKTPGLRYPTALALAEDLRRYREGRPVLARRAGAAEQAWRWCRRNPVVAGLIAGVLCVSAAGASVAGVYAVRADESADAAREQARLAGESAREAALKEAEATAARWEEARQRGIATELARQAVEREAVGRRERYALDANLSLKAWEAGDVLRARQFLAAYTPRPGRGPDFRGFEWHYLDRLCRAESRAYPLNARGAAGLADPADGSRFADAFAQGNEAPLYNLRTAWLALHPDGSRFAFAQGKEFGIYDRRAGVLPVVFRGHATPVSGLAWSPRADRIASSGFDGTVRIWAADSGELLQTLRHPHSATRVAYTPDGRTLISGGGPFEGPMQPGEVIIWDLAGGRPRHTLREHQSAVSGLAVSADGKLLASCGFDGAVHLHDTETGAHVRTLRASRPLTSVAIHPGRKWVAAGSTQGPIFVYDLGSGALLRELHSHSAWVYSLAFDPAGSVLASGGMDAGVRVWNPETGELLRHLRGHVGAVSAVGFAPKGPDLVSVGDDGVARVWDVRKPLEYTTLADGIFLPVAAATAAGGTQLVTVTGTGTVTRRAASTGAVVAEDPNFSGGKYLMGATVFPDGGTVAIVHAYRISYRSLTGRPLPPALVKIDEGTDVAAAEGGRWLAVQPHPRRVHLHDLTRPDGTREMFFPGKDVSSFTFGPGGSPVLAVAVGPDTVRLVHTAGGDAAEIAVGADGPIRNLAFSPDGLTLAGSDARSRVRLWDVRSGQEVWRCDAHTGEVRSVAFSPRGDRIVTAGMDRTAKVLDAVTGRETISLRGHQRGVWRALFAHDGTSVITVGLDHKALLWAGGKGP